MSPNWQNSYFFILFGAAILHGIYLCFLIFFRSKPIKGQHWLGLVLAGVVSLLVNYFIYISGAINSYPHLLNVFVPLPYVIGPSLYIFIQISSGKSFTLRWIHLFHLLPLIWALWESIPVYQWSTAQKLMVVEGILGDHVPTLYELLMGNRLNFFLAAYAIAALIQLRKSAANAWLKKFTGVFLMLISLSITLPAIMLLMSWNGAYFELIITLAYAISLHVLGFTLLNHGDGVPWVAVSVKYQNSPLSKGLLKSYQKRVTDYLEEQRPWLDPGFSITDLSSAVDIPKHHLSQLFNQSMAISFTDLVNTYRVEAAKHMLRSGDLEKYSIMGIATNCGFASKSTFNRAFKKCCGLTPTAYLNQAELPPSVPNGAI